MTKKEQLFEEIQKLNKSLLKELFEQDALYNVLSTKLINETPSGELRNNITELNILHNNLMNIYNDLYRLKTL